MDNTAPKAFSVISIDPEVVAATGEADIIEAENYTLIGEDHFRMSEGSSANHITSLVEAADTVIVEFDSTRTPYTSLSPFKPFMAIALETAMAQNKQVIVMDALDTFIGSAAERLVRTGFTPAEAWYITISHFCFLQADSTPDASIFPVLEKLLENTTLSYEQKLLFTDKITRRILEHLRNVNNGVFTSPMIEFSKAYNLLDIQLRDLEYASIVREHLSAHPESHPVIVVGKGHVNNLNRLLSTDSRDLLPENHSLGLVYEYAKDIRIRE